MVLCSGTWWSIGGGGVDIITLQRFLEELSVDEFLPLLQNYIIDYPQLPIQTLQHAQKFDTSPPHQRRYRPWVLREWYLLVPP